MTKCYMFTRNEWKTTTTVIIVDTHTHARTIMCTYFYIFTRDRTYAKDSREKIKIKTYLNRLRESL